MKLNAARAEQIVGSFGEPAQLVRVTADYDTAGRYSEVEADPVAVTAATAPASSRDARVRALEEDGVRLDAMRMFWLTEQVSPAVKGTSSGDLIVWAQQRWRVHSVERWGPFGEVVGVRQ